MMESTPSRDTGDIILDVTLLAENVAKVSYWKAEVSAYLLFTSMAVLALKNHKKELDDNEIYWSMRIV